MNPLDLFNQVKELIENKDFSAAKTFVEENKDQLGEYLSQAQALSLTKVFSELVLVFFDKGFCSSQIFFLD